MKKTILITLLCASLMLVTPLTSVAQENTISSNIPDIPDDIKGLVEQIRAVADELYEKYGYIPMVMNLCNIIFISLDLIGQILLCIFLTMITIPLLLIVAVVFAILNVIPPIAGGLLFIILSNYDRNCPPGTPFFDWFSSFQSIYTMLETKDNINTFDGCPCLQE